MKKFKMIQLINKVETRIEETVLSKKIKTEIAQMLLDVKNEAINYTRCCTELKSKETITFEEWLFVNDYKKLFDYFVKDSVSFTESELIQIYNNQVMSL
jgi:hypothetical protein